MRGRQVLYASSAVLLCTSESRTHEPHTCHQCPTDAVCVQDVLGDASSSSGAAENVTGKDLMQLLSGAPFEGSIINWYIR